VYALREEKRSHLELLEYCGEAADEEVAEWTANNVHHPRAIKELSGSSNARSRVNELGAREIYQTVSETISNLTTGSSFLLVLFKFLSLLPNDNVEMRPAPVSSTKFPAALAPRTTNMLSKHSEQILRNDVMIRSGAQLATLADLNPN
jgi:hypothetical protein